MSKKSYRLVLLDGADKAIFKTIQFEAFSPGAALPLVGNHKGLAQLWVEDQQLCTLVCSGTAGFWVIEGAQSRPSSSAHDERALESATTKEHDFMFSQAGPEAEPSEVPRVRLYG